jgi:two-component system NtrC family sensor kinase
MASMLNLDEIMGKILRALTEVMYLDSGYLMLVDEKSNEFKVHSQMGTGSKASSLLINRSSPLIKEVGRRKREVSRHSLEEWARTRDDPSILKDDFTRLGGAVIIPMIFKGEINGLLVLGNKRSGDLFTPEDLELLRTLADQCAISIENAKAYQLIEDLNVNLEKMVEERTHELQRALEEKEKAQDLLIRSESLASVGALAAGVAHELNNPIASASSLVQSAIETMEDMPRNALVKSDRGAEDKDEMIDDLKFGLKELNRAKDIVASLLGVSRQTEEYFEPVDMNDVCKDALKVLSNQYKGTGIEIVEDYEEILPETKGNFANLGQVCLNIINNAIQVVDSRDGKIVIKTRYDEHGSIVVFECEDDGPGISEEVMKDMFKPFFTTKEVGKGTGLGLYISHEIVRRHNGNIYAKNNPKGGATFRVELPVAR